MSRRAILFDMDGTLVDSEPLHQHALAAVLAHEGAMAPPGFDEASTGLSMQAAYALLRANSTLQLDYDTLVAAKYAAFLAGAGTLQLRHGAAEAIALARRMARAYAIVSNSDRMLVSATLGATGLVHPDLISVVEDSPAGAMAGLAAGMTVVAWPEPHRHDLLFPQGVLHCAGDVSTLLRQLLLSTPN
jgi:HAD superfamily hydrolase (TIGR01509 family)